ncbi:MAG: aldo/keto reductase [Theionarchaea archaeon]|nr:aldo/keto reductase [Theionarchaea archaeon]
MEYRTHKGIDLSEIGVGLYALAGVYGKKDVKGIKKMLTRAHELGITVFDTAEAYGNAESVLGETAAPFRDEIFIATKVGIREGTEPNLSEEYVKAACDDSLQRLQTEYIDLYQVHFDDPSTRVEETIGALNDLVAMGKIRHYGVGHLPEERVKRYCQKGNPFSILMELSAVSRRSLTTLLPLCRAYNTGGIAFSTTGRGILTGRFDKTPQFEPEDIRNIDPLFQREQFESALRIAHTCRTIAVLRGRTPVQVALAWVLEQPGIICALTGPSSIPHLKENCGGSGWSLPLEDMTELLALFEREDQWVRTRQTETIKSIVSSPLPRNFSEGFKDLLYVMETSITANIAPEEIITPFFHELIKTRKEKDQKKLREIQGNLKGLLNSLW